MKLIVMVLLAGVCFSAAQDSVGTKGVASKDAVAAKKVAIPHNYKKRAQDGSIDLTHVINKPHTFAGLLLDSVYGAEVIAAWESIAIPVNTKKLFIGKGILPANAAEIYGRMLMSCGIILPYEQLKGKEISAVKGRCFEFAGTLFQQFETKAGIYSNSSDYFYLTLLAGMPEAVSGWVRVDSTFSYFTAMGEEKTLVHLKEILLFIETKRE